MKRPFKYIVDHTDIAPFAKLPTPEELGKEPGRAVKGSDHWPANLTNGFTADDTWRFTYSIILDAGHKTKWTMDLPKEEELVSLKIKINQIYHKITKINLYVDDDPEPVVAQLRPDGAIQEVPLAGKRGKRITFEIADWEETGRQNVVGIDNFWLYVKRDEEYLENTRPLLNIGGLMRYNRGKGGIVLNQLNILDQEKLPLNKTKKANITKVLLANMGAVFAGAKTIVAGAGLQYEPVRDSRCPLQRLCQPARPSAVVPGPGRRQQDARRRPGLRERGLPSVRLLDVARADRLHAQGQRQRSPRDGNRRHPGGSRGRRRVLPAHLQPERFDRRLAAAIRRGDTPRPTAARAARRVPVRGPLRRRRAGDRARRLADGRRALGQQCPRGLARRRRRLDRSAER